MYNKRPIYRLNEDGFEPIYCSACGELLLITSDKKTEYYICPNHGRIEIHDFSKQIHPEDYQ